MKEGAESDKEKCYALWLGDVVVIGGGEDHTNLVLTAAAKRRPRSVSLYIEEEEDEEEGQEEEANTSRENGNASTTPAKRNKKDGASGSTRNGTKENGDIAPEVVGGRGHRRTILEQKTRVSPPLLTPAHAQLSGMSLLMP